MLDIGQAEKFFNSFTVLSRQTNRPIPFRLNPSQQAIMEALKKHMARKRRPFVIFLKGRRLGVSTWARMMLMAHVLEKEFAEALILGQLKTTARALYEEQYKLCKQLPIRKSAWKYTQQEIQFWNLPSRISWQTAGNVVGARGLGFTALHATEAAYYQNPDVFPAVFSTVSDDQENMTIVETTPNGIEGPGQAYHDLWEASVRGDTEYLTIFLPWHDDPDYIRDPQLAKDAPRDDYEKYLMRDLKLPKERIAFYRQTITAKCGGSLDRWRRDWPGDPEEAFIASGDPVFNFDDLSIASNWAKDTAYTEIELEAHPPHRATARPHSHGRYVIYERPEPAAHYFMGVMIGNSDRLDDGMPEDDMLAAVVWNGESGVLAARMHIPLRQETATQTVYAFGCYYNRAMIACEDGGGGFGTRIFQELRDRWRYPNQYKWKGRNDKIDPLRSSNSLGFTLTDYTRKMCLNAILTSIKRREAITSDAAFTEQMSSVQWTSQWRFEAIANFDEIFYAGALGWIAKDQWHPRKCEAYQAAQNEDLFDIKGINFKISHMNTDNGILTMNLQHHLDDLRKAEEQRDRYAD